MRRLFCVLTVFFLFLASLGFSAEKSSAVKSLHIQTNYVDIYKDISNGYVGNWQKYGQTFENLQKNYFKTIYLSILVAIPLIFILHYLLIGPKKFSHEGKKILIFTVLNRIIHWTAALSFLTLVITGLIMVFGKYFGGGSFVRFFRYLHFPAAVVFTPFGFFMFLMWLKDMIFAPGDITWFLKFGGYLSRKNENIMPVGKFNPGQKSWFWLATLGGFVMAYTGYYMYSFSDFTDNLRIYAMIHNILGMALLVMFLVHLYMSLFAIKGSLNSMLTGFKSEDEIRVMHCRFYKKISGKDCVN
ncbi:MAG: formate dehydrogenase subunit gamma [Deferribacteres bacterium]|jgi:formate dehydrogenase subunit gamma|nr:formate dehydrogenase, gamma subunit [Deferribacteraceae bacterium]MDK2793027.1 formate dehydrogenase subunit gamma [Deferribacteres bacterium]